jgi:hypothetical protein
MSNTTIAIRFAQGSTTGKGSHLFIEGDTIYSYGYHFPVARRNADGTVWLNPDKYSVSTTRHQSLVRNALAKAGIPTV